MAVDYRTAIQDGEPIKTIASVTTNFTEILYSDTVKRITVGCEHTDLYLSFSYTDGESGTNTNAAVVAKNSYFSMSVPNGVDSCVVAARSGTAVNVTFIMEVFV